MRTGFSKNRHQIRTTFLENKYHPATRLYDVTFWVYWNTTQLRQRLTHWLSSPTYNRKTIKSPATLSEHIFNWIDVSTKQGQILSISYQRSLLRTLSVTKDHFPTLQYPIYSRTQPMYHHFSYLQCCGTVDKLDSYKCGSSLQYVQFLPCNITTLQE